MSYVVRPSVCRLSVCLSVCRLFVTFVRPTQAIEIFGNILHDLVRWPSADIQVKFYEDRPRGTPSSGVLNTRGVAKYRYFGPIQRYISETLQDRSQVSITNRKSHMSFRLVPNSVTLDDVEWRNSHIRIVISPNSVAFVRIT